MPNYVPTTSYGWAVSDLSDIVEDLDRIQKYSDEKITEVEATLAPSPSEAYFGIIDTSNQDLEGWMAPLPLPTDAVIDDLSIDAVIDYLSITHRNIYRLPITPDQRCIIKKYLRLIENEVDENRGVAGPRSPSTSQ